MHAYVLECSTFYQVRYNIPCFVQRHAIICHAIDFSWAMTIMKTSKDNFKGWNKHDLIDKLQQI